jgi:uracil-DNA glycosylase
VLSLPSRSSSGRPSNSGAALGNYRADVTRRPLELLLENVRACRVCEADLPAGPRPVLRAGEAAGVVIIGQAPGRRVHESGVPWDDPSGVRLRSWLGVDEVTFYDESKFAIIPMGFCYPGSATSGDLPPRPECAPLWHESILAELGTDLLHVVIGQYAQARYVPERSKTLTETVKRFREFMPDRVVLPHPSPRNVGWFGTNPWFEEEVVPALRARVALALRQSGPQTMRP